MNFTLKIWRQRNAEDNGRFVNYYIKDISPGCSFLEMLDTLNKNLIDKFESPLCFDHDCREGICGACGLYINGRPHGPDEGVTTCQLYMRKFKDEEVITVEPWRAKAFPVIKDLVVDRSSLDKIIQSGGYITVNKKDVPDANDIPIPEKDIHNALNAAECIGCGACVAACKNASAMLFVAAKVSHFALLPQGKKEAKIRVERMMIVMEDLGFGNCTNSGACESECPKKISIAYIAKLYRELYNAKIG